MQKKYKLILYLIIITISITSCKGNNKENLSPTTKTKKIISIEDLNKNYILLSIKSEKTLLPNIVIKNMDIMEKTDVQIIADELFKTGKTIKEELNKASIPFENIFITSSGLFFFKLHF